MSPRTRRQEFFRRPQGSRAGSRTSACTLIRSGDRFARCRRTAEPTKPVAPRSTIFIWFSLTSSPDQRNQAFSYASVPGVARYSGQNPLFHVDSQHYRGYKPNQHHDKANPIEKEDAKEKCEFQAKNKKLKIASDTISSSFFSEPKKEFPLLAQKKTFLVEEGEKRQSVLIFNKQLPLRPLIAITKDVVKYSSLAAGKESTLTQTGRKRVRKVSGTSYIA